jgi:CheY-like chemotaxis protein
MIYLIDDKTLRQKDFGWSEDKFTLYSSILKPLYKIEDIIKIGETLYEENNVILYHESFLDFTIDKDKALKQREKLTKIASTSPRLSVAFFSGSQGGRSLNGNISYLPVSKLYQNLEILVKQHSQGSVELKYLLFGENPEIEEELNEKLTLANRKIEENPIVLTGKSLFFHPDEDFIQNAIIGAHNEEIYYDNDAELTEIVLNLLSENEYDNIFLPLCFGQTLSDFNGLKLAAHIRCTPTKNQLKRIFIYGFVGLDYLLEHEYFNILKTKNIQLVSYSKKDFATAANTPFESLKPEELSKEIKKIKLDPPLNYFDSHSIANEWAIYRWARSINAIDCDIEKVKLKVNSNIYFKYLQTIFAISEVGFLNDNQLKINHVGDHKILYIDDDSDRGWSEVFCKILYDLNKLEFEYLGDEFSDKNQDEIIDICHRKLIDYDPTLVILDLRIAASDFNQYNNSNNFTGFKILKLIKKINPGIRVIIFTASQKALIFLELLKAGADGFAFKESPDVNGLLHSSQSQIIGFVKTVRNQLLYKFQKILFSKLNELKEYIYELEIEDKNEFNSFVKNIIKQLDVIFNCLRQIDLNNYVSIDITYLACFNYFELFKNYYLNFNKDFRYYLGCEEVELYIYEVDREYKTVTNKGLFVAIKSMDRPSWFNVISGLFVDYFKITPHFEDEVILNLKRVSDWRNNYIHNKKEHFDLMELEMIFNLLFKFCENIKD